MQMVIARANNTSGAVPPSAIACHDVRNPRNRNEILVRKGSALTDADVQSLLGRGVAELHLAVPASDDVGEDLAAERLARAAAGPGTESGEAHFGQVSFTSASRGVLRVDVERLERMNALVDVLLLSAEPDRPVDVGDTLGVVKCAPLFLGERILAAAEDVGPVLNVQPFEPTRVAFIAPGERLRGGAFERARSALADALAWYGSTLCCALPADATVDALATAYRQALQAGAGLIFAAGASGTDPYDVVFEGLRRAGGDVLQLGIPAEPGTACWISELHSTPVLGLASCELFGQPGALDLLLPRLFTGEPLDRTLLRRIALGGLLHGPSRIAPFHARAGSVD